MSRYPKPVVEVHKKLWRAGEWKLTHGFMGGSRVPRWYDRATLVNRVLDLVRTLSIELRYR